MASNFKLGLIINPVAGMGGKVGLHGTDNDLAQIAISHGAEKISFDRAQRTISMLVTILTFTHPVELWVVNYLRCWELTFLKLI